jgi:hypothetical protein
MSKDYKVRVTGTWTDEILLSADSKEEAIAIATETFETMWVVLNAEFIDSEEERPENLSYEPFDSVTVESVKKR